MLICQSYFDLLNLSITELATKIQVMFLDVPTLFHIKHLYNHAKYMNKSSIPNANLESTTVHMYAKRHQSVLM